MPSFYRTGGRGRPPPAGAPSYRVGRRPGVAGGGFGRVLAMRADVVVGAASGMGAAIARRLGGRRIVLADLDVDGAERVADELRAATGGVGAAAGADVEVRRCDLADDDDVAALVSAVGERGELGALVMTAGLSPTMAPGRRIYEVDLLAPARLVAAFEPTAGAGSVALLFASMAGHLAPADAGVDAVLDAPGAPSFFDDLAAAGIDVDEPAIAYTLAKRGLMRLARREAGSWGKRDARLLTLSPGIVDTPMGRQEAASQPMMATMVTGSPLGRELTADEVAAVAAFLVSDAASAMTGTDVLVDGGVIAALTS